MFFSLQGIVAFFKLYSLRRADAIDLQAKTRPFWYHISSNTFPICKVQGIPINSTKLQVQSKLNDLCDTILLV